MGPSEREAWKPDPSLKNQKHELYGLAGGALAAEERQSSCGLVILGTRKPQMLPMDQLRRSERRLAWGHLRSSPKPTAAERR